MSAKRAAPDRVSDSSSQFFSVEAQGLRELLERADLSQRAAARLLDVDERTVRYWCAGRVRAPSWVFRALSPRLTHSENLRRMVASDEVEIAALEDGRISGMGFGPDPGGPRSVAMELDRLRRRVEENRALLRLDEATERKREAFLKLSGQWSPDGSGLPTDESISEMDAAESEFRAAQAEVDRIAQEIRTGKRR